MISVKFETSVVQELELELIKAQNLNNFDLYKKVWCLLMIHEGISFSTIARRLNKTIKTVYNWLKAFMSRRFNWLLMHHYRGRGRKSKLTKDQEKNCMTLL